MVPGKGASLRCRSALFAGDRSEVGLGETDRITMRVSLTNFAALGLDVLTVLVDVSQDV